MAAGDFSELPPVELLPATSMPGAAGAYAASTGTVYLNQDWFKTASEEQIQAVLTEELGHHLDAQFTEVDTPGDEGELFARQLLGEELSSEQQQAIQLQNDQIQILVDGQKINAEASQFSWPQQVGGSANVDSNDIYALADGSSLITGSFQGMARFGDKVLTSTTQDEEDIFVAKLNPDGSFAWVTQAGGSEDDGSNSITALSDGSSIITGYIEGTARFGNEIISKSNSSSDVFIGKLNPDGSFAWVVQAGGDESNINGRSISALNDGSLLLQGYFDGTAVFGDISITAENSDKGNVFIAKLNPDGGFAWATQGPPTSEFASSNNFATFADGSSLITGSFRGIQSFGDITLTSTEEGEEADDFSNDGFSDDIYVAKLSPNGEFVWASQSVGPGTEEARGISTSSDGSSIITGYFKSKNDTQAAGFGSTLLSYKGSFSQELFVAKLNTNGDWEWASQSFGSQENSGKDVSTLSDGSSLVTGYISGTTGFGSTDLIKEESGEENVVIAKLSPDGEFEWATQAGGSLSDYGKSITPLADGSSLIFGEFGDTASFGDVSLVSEGDLDLYEDARNGFIAKLNANGTWASSELGDEVSDTTAPTLISYELSSYNFDLSNGDVTIDVSAQITDDISGVFDGTYANGNGGSPSQARWRSPSGNQFLDAGYFSTPSTGNFLDGIYTDQTVLDANSEIGTWTLDYFLLADEASNLKSLNKDEVAALGIQTTFEVSDGSKVDPTKSVIRGNSLYTIVDGPTWEEAEANANALGGHLVTINDAEENDWLFNAFEIQNERYLDVGGQLYLTGFTDREQEGDWRWISGEAVTYTNWAVGEPNNSYNGAPEDFMHLGWAANRKWNDVPSNFEYSPDTVGIAETPFIRRGDSAYVIVEGPTWEEAEANANALGGHLVTINDAEENDWLFNAFEIQNERYL
ncbi:lectin-like protein, partial [Synechococcus sp. MU1655]|uniref:lectin-like protein n=1 Tax=Synechococcus sp. MU1655 TaxID=2508355 RepID=UPI00202688DB